MALPHAPGSSCCHPDSKGAWSKTSYSARGYTAADRTGCRHDARLGPPITKLLRTRYPFWCSVTTEGSWSYGQPGREVDGAVAAKSATSALRSGISHERRRLPGQAGIAPSWDHHPPGSEPQNGRAFEVAASCSEARRGSGSLTSVDRARYRLSGYSHPDYLESPTGTRPRLRPRSPCRPAVSRA